MLPLQIDASLGLTRTLAGCSDDLRDNRLVDHSMVQMLVKRIYLLGIGFDFSAAVFCKRRRVAERASGKIGHPFSPITVRPAETLRNVCATVSERDPHIHAQQRAHKVANVHRKTNNGANHKNRSRARVAMLTAPRRTTSTRPENPRDSHQREVRAI